MEKQWKLPSDKCISYIYIYIYIYIYNKPGVVILEINCNKSPKKQISPKDIRILGLPV